ncbi:MAG: aldehyde dehydrogenase family protein [Chromatiales bacterium]|nr:aldehyde dehydrogenase family protein [Chromatiales bacterium]
MLADADLDHAAQLAVTSRFLNNGQSCIAAKRIILVPRIAAAFLRALHGPPPGPQTGRPASTTTPTSARWPAPTCATPCTAR